MSTQQILLIVLAILIIGISIAIALVYFNDHSAAANRDGLTNDLINLSVRVHQYFVRPKTWGGGEKSFEGLTMQYLTSHPQNAHGTISIVSVDSTKVVLEGVGISRGSDGNLITVRMTVFPDSLSLNLTN